MAGNQSRGRVCRGSTRTRPLSTGIPSFHPSRGRIPFLPPSRWSSVSSFALCSSCSGTRPGKGKSCRLSTIRGSNYDQQVVNWHMLLLTGEERKRRRSPGWLELGQQRKARVEGEDKSRYTTLYLYDPHGQSRLLGQLLPDVSGRLRGLREGRLEDLELFGLYGCPGTPPLPSGPVVWTLVLAVLSLHPVGSPVSVH